MKPAIRSVTAIAALTAFAGSGLAGCSSMSQTERGAVIGAAGGAAVGAVVGRQVGSTARGAVIGAVVGGFVGSLFGYPMVSSFDNIAGSIPSFIFSIIGAIVVLALYRLATGRRVTA